ncbi:type I DNA topoisomerase [Fontivita pretiosa]|uniref:type I DNA topoisomerase n=1 Tax=Fontivita pretiosa TaxID=2989684 RepID=UPI003D17ADF6
MAKKSGKNLVIVESPAKARTINKYLGDGYIVKASMGHVRDLPAKGMGVNLKTFEPQYEILQNRRKVVTELKKLAGDANEVYLATDLDREGEAIAWHLKEALGIPDERVKRVIFNAITKSEIQKAFRSPNKINIDKVNAQQARRILDRIVGYEISPLLWRKVARGLSAGRVQSVAVRLIVEREREIEKFIPAEYWKIGAIFAAAGQTSCAELSRQWIDFLTNTGNGERTRQERDRWLAEHSAFYAELIELGGRKFEPNNKADARRAAELLGFVVENENTTEDPEGKGPARFLTSYTGRLGQCPPFTIRGIERKRTTSRPPAPFITSTLQQGAASRLGFGAQRTMRLAQSLYEAGYITYMRTDSTNLSPEALNMVREYIGRTFGDRYLPQKPNYYASSNKAAQEAHEAIRPTDVNFTPHDAHAKLGQDEYKLYQLIWNRFVACQMPPAEFDQTTLTIVAATQQGEAVFRATGRKLVFDGFMRVSGVSSEDQLLPELAEGASVHPIEITPTQHFTQPPPRFTEASLVKELERLGIGRPSTYASIIQTIQDRRYVVQKDRRFYATLLGSIVTDKLMQGFPQIMDVKFTADMETDLDKIEEQHLDWIKLLRDFYGPFRKDVKAAMEKLEHAGGTESPYKCDKCGSPMVYRINRNVFFLACTNRAGCGATKPVDDQGRPTVREVSEHKCPVCGREMIRRRGRFGEFLGCSGYSIKNEKGEPVCSTIINLDKQGNPLPPKPKPIPTTVKCEKCGSDMLLRDSKRGPFLGCSSFPKCRATKMVKKLTGDDLKQVEALLPLLKNEEAKSQEIIARIIGENPAAAGAMKTGPIPTDIDCDECGKPMVIRTGRRGKFLGCSGYPKCKNTAEVPAKLLEEMGLNGNGANGNNQSKPAVSDSSAAAAIDPEPDEQQDAA